MDRFHYELSLLAELTFMRNFCLYYIIYTVVLSLVCTVTFTQDNDSTTLSSFSSQKINKYTRTVAEKSAKLQTKIEKTSEKALQRFRKQELKIIAQVAKKDSIKAKILIEDFRNKYAALEQTLNANNIPGGKYIPKLDTLLTSMKYLENIPGLKNVSQLSDQFDKADFIKSFIQERKANLQWKLEGITNLKGLKQFQKTVYYYQQQLKEYKELLKNSKKAERKAIELLSKTKLFKDFIRRNSQLASLFQLPGSATTDSSPTGVERLQTRAQLNNLLQQRLGSDPQTRNLFNQNLQGAQGALQEIKSKFINKGISNSSDELPDFKPNQQKTKSFLKRMELGMNIQLQKSTNYFPTTSDVAVSLGYKLNDRSIIGIGSSYKIGWGTGLKDIRISTEGMGLRSFIDYKIKGSLWVSGGYEKNYRTVGENIVNAQTIHSWQESGLIGMSKVVSIKSKIFKKTKLQLLYDFLANKQLPRNAAIQFRLGYSFN